MSLDNEQSKVIQGRFHLTRKLGAGSFGEIFEAKDLKTGKLYACKAESLRTKHPQLRLEYQIYRALQNSKSFVRVWGYVTHYNHQIMIMDKLGDSLEQLFTLCGRKFSIRCVCAIAIQILTRIEELHKHNYLHRDIKPDNFLIGHTLGNDYTSAEAGKVYMIDLGLGKVWKEGGRHIPEKHGKRLIGTPRYASINTHFGHEQSRRDDLESLGYMLMYFACGQLPWQGLRGQTKEEKYQKIGHKKRDTRLSELCAGYPDEFRQYLSATQKLSFQTDPPYETYRSWFRNVLKRYQTHSSFDFDWQNRANHTNAKVSKSHHRIKKKYHSQNVHKIATNNVQTRYHSHRATHNNSNTHQTYQRPTANTANVNVTANATANNNNNALVLPNLGTANQFNNYVDRYQRCRTMLQQQTNGNGNTVPNTVQNNTAQNGLHSPNNVTNGQNMQMLFPNRAQQQCTANNSHKRQSFMSEYAEMVGAYKKMEAQTSEFKRMWQTSESNYKKLKQKCQSYVYSLNDAQQTIVAKDQIISKLTAELSVYRQRQSYPITHQTQPAHKRRKLNNNGLQRRH